MDKTEIGRLEGLWAGEFGEAYVERNKEAAKGRDAFWQMLLAKYPVTSALEVGCNLGGNLTWVSQHVPPCQTYGVDINEHALARLHEALPHVNAIWAPARQLPFRDQWFQLVFTAGVLIHQPSESLPLVMAEIVRCSKRYVLCMEYFAQDVVEVPYRGHEGALFKRDYGGLYQMLFPELKLVEQGFLTKDQGWDDITWWLFEKTGTLAP
ncbi:MAG: methyltransferase type 11 [Cyanobacteria bacterium RYN_339]|nr:methyltransferase type 11 [Cyanobacteria bacterium RYN_339]